MCSCGKPSPERSRSSAEIGKSAHRNSLSKTRVFERTAHRAALLPNLVVACFADFVFAHPIPIAGRISAPDAQCNNCG